MVTNPKRLTDLDINRIIAKWERITVEECVATKAHEAVLDSIHHCAPTLEKFTENLLEWGWYDRENLKDAYTKTACLMKRLGYKPPFRYHCHECGTRVEVKVR